MPSFVDISGNRYDRLVVLHRVDNDFGNRVCWLCQCDCGNKVIVRSNNLRTDRTHSCGCIRLESITTHQHTKTPTYQSWTHMLNRCRSSSDGLYKYYKGRGITVCERWFSFENFLIDMGERPKGKTLERIDNNGNYEPSNVQWATRSEQSNNTCRNHLLTYNGRTQTVMQWSREFGISHNMLYHRIRRGWSVERVLSISK